MNSSPQSFRPNLGFALIGFAVLFGLALVGMRSLQGDGAGLDAPRPERAGVNLEAGDNPPGSNSSSDPGSVKPLASPTPDLPHALPAQRTQAEQYTSQPGDSLAEIAKRYQVGVQQIVQANDIPDPNLLEVGQSLTIPLPLPENAGPSFKVVPDSELVYGPSGAGFDITGFVQGQGGYLSSYREELDGRQASGGEIVERVANEYSVNPRMLLAVLEYQSGWVTRRDPPAASLVYPIRLDHPNWKGLYRQLSWAANQLNRGYYLWRVNGVGAWNLADGSVIPASPQINPGTAGAQNMFAQLYGRAGWLEAVGDGGVYETFQALFGNPFGYSFEPVMPPDLQQPPMQLPIEIGKVWSFTGGPHGGWADGSAWAALDFAPPGEALGCVPSDEWVVAVADGRIVRTGDGAVVQDLDGDGYAQTGWVVLYMHIDSNERVAPGTYLKAGEKVGHPSCEGGFSNGTHVHLARRYNGEWIPADQNLPFELDGWVSSGAGKEYDGYLSSGGASIEAYEGRSEINQIQR